MKKMGKVDVVVSRECPLILDSTASPSCFGTMALEKGAYVEISATMNISIDLLKRADEEDLKNAIREFTGKVRENPKFDFYVTGADGAVGKDGENGKDGEESGDHGCPGQPGSVGKRGGDAPQITIEIKEIQDSDFSLLNVGGKGGDGGKGGRGGNGRKSSGAGGDGGDGGNGGNGGNGGDGADLIVKYPENSQYSINAVDKVARPGEGGICGTPGMGGSGNPSGKPGKTASPGVIGVSGMQGRTKYVPLKTDTTACSAVFERFGGEDLVQEKYPAVYKGILKGLGSLSANEDTSQESFDLDAPGFYRVAIQKKEGVSGKEDEIVSYLTSNATGKFTKGMEYVFMTGTLKNDKGEIEDTFAREYNATSEYMVSDISEDLSAYMQDILKMNDVKYHSEGKCYTVDAEGKVYFLPQQKSEATVVDGGESIVKKLTVTDPAHKNKEPSDKIIVLYGREPKDEETKTWDYKYEEVVAENEEVDTYLKLSGIIEMKDNYIVNGYANAGFKIKLYYLGNDEPTATYNYSQETVGGFFHVLEDGKKCTFGFNENWNCKLSTKDYNASCLQMLKASFYIAVTNTKTKVTELIPIAINSTTDPSKPLFEAEGTAVYVPQISLRWGCFHKDTRILMQDGTKKAVSEICIGDMVMLVNGKSSKVKGCYRGEEDNLVCLETKEGLEIMLTKSHPVLCGNGRKRAKDVRPGDLVVTEGGGKQEIKFAYEIPYGDTVYSLELEESGDLIANGIAAGDFTVQNSMPQQKRKEPRTEEVQEVIDELRQMLRDFQMLKE